MTHKYNLKHGLLVGIQSSNEEIENGELVEIHGLVGNTYVSFYSQSRAVMHAPILHI